MPQEDEQHESIPSFDDPSTGVSVEDTSTASFSDRAKRTKGGSPWPMLIAVLLGGGVAVGIVKMIPNDWLPRKQAPQNDPEKSSPVENEERRNDSTNRTSNGFSDAEQLATKSSESPRPRRTTEQTPEDPLAKLAKQREEEAGSLLRRAKALRKINRNDDAVELIERILNRYEDTKAAVAAEKYLRDINRR